MAYSPDPDRLRYPVTGADLLDLGAAAVAGLLSFGLPLIALILS